MFTNGFRLTGDFLHATAILLLIFHIIKNRSCHAISGISMILYAITFSFRYMDLFTFNIFYSQNLFIYNTMFKIYYLFTNYFILILIYGVFRNTRDKSVNTLPIFVYLISAHLLTWGTCYLTDYKQLDKEFFWRFSIFLEMLVIIPQLTLIYKQKVIGEIMICYLIMLGFYRAFYVANWLYRYKTENFWEPIGFFSGCIQTIIYLVFFTFIFPCLNNENKWQSKDGDKDLIYIIDTKESIDQDTDDDDVPLVHDIV
ncbi:unnamed protein product [Adineta steineri]|uniref:ER lumen protein retaining receptor n=1 Tax=Adineta steineri TaxID=433720 RepID=A0A819EEH0_9BILA|nr:unnamed protein product [Adineta steineri]CAF3850512.1 unnamed protein product [Adineta steineri]